jgi:hypothetical protein
MRKKIKKSSIVKVFNVSDTKANCQHEDKIPYTIRDGYQYYYCPTCGNLIREPLS